MSDQMKELAKSVRHLVALDPVVDDVGPAIVDITDALQGLDSVGDTPDINSVEEQIDRMFSAAAVPARNYGRMAKILQELKGVCVAARKPHNARARPRVAGVVKKVAGLFAEVDTAEDLDKPLAEIERAVHALYGDQSKNRTFYPGQRGKGNRSGE